MSLNTFETQLQEYFGGSTGSTLGPNVLASYLEGTYSDTFQVAKTGATLQRGVQLAADSSQTAYIDFNSLNNATNDYDTRIISVGGELGVNGRGVLGFNANEYHLNGNTTEPEPEYRMPGYTQQPAIPILPSVNQGRTYALRSYQWTGTAGTDPVNPLITIQLRDPVSLAPWFGVFDVYMSSAYDGTGDVFASPSWTIVKNATPPTNIVEVEPARSGPALSILYAEADWNVVGYPQFKLFNKQAGSTFRYIIKATVFPDNDGF